MFAVFDTNSSGTIAFDQFIQSLQEYSAYGNDEKVSLLFKIFDRNGEVKEG